MIKKIKGLFKKAEVKPFDHGSVTEAHLEKYYNKIEKHPYRRIFQYIWKHKKLFIPSLVISLFYTFINVLPPFIGQMAIALTGGKPISMLENIPFLKQFQNFDVKSISGQLLTFDTGVDPAVVAQFFLVMVIGVIYVILRVGFDYIKTFLFSFTAQVIGQDVRTDMLKGLLHTDISYFKQEQEGALMSRLINESNSIENFAASTVPNLITVPLTLILTLTMLFILNVKLTLVCLIAAPILSLGINFISKLIRTRVTMQQNLLGNMVSAMQEDIRGIEVIKIFSKEDEEIKRYRSITTELIKFMRKMQMILSINRPMTEFVMIIAMLLILSYGGFLVFNGEMPFEFLWGFLLYMLNVSVPVKDLSGIFVNLSITKGIALRVFQVIDLPAENVSDPTKIKMPPVSDSIIFQNIHFEYPKRDTNTKPFHLGPVNINVKKGDVVAFVGNSGGGKSTLINLIPKLMEPQEGSLIFDGIDSKDINIRSLREQIGVVSQENILFYGTVRENITYGDKEATDEEVMAAAKIAHAHDFISALPQGYTTHIGPRGVMLSGGQRQRIALARAVLKRPSILILDEATSALDTESEMHVQNALNEIIHMQTTFIIAHRLSTIKNANKIYVIEDGKVIESGTHDDLMKTETKYKRLYSLQFR